MVLLGVNLLLISFYVQHCMVLQARVHRYALHWYRITQRSRLKKDHSTENNLRSVVTSTCELSNFPRSPPTESPSHSKVLVSERRSYEGKDLVCLANLGQLSRLFHLVVLISLGIKRKDTIILFFPQSNLIIAKHDYSIVVVVNIYTNVKSRTFLPCLFVIFHEKLKQI